MERLARFKVAQASPGSGLESALAELRAGRKTGHWIWYVFPQLAGLGRSAMAEEFAVADRDEAVAYLEDPLLRHRLLTAATLVADQQQHGVSLSRLMGAPVDVLKLVSSMTLFGEIARRLSETVDDEYARLAEAADRILGAAAAEEYPPCAHTLRSLGR